MKVMSSLCSIKYHTINVLASNQVFNIKQFHRQCVIVGAELSKCKNYIEIEVWQADV